MNNHQLLPFERNKYYYGKILTSADFQTEQQYGNAKRWFMNQLICGQGVLRGMDVRALDSISVYVDSGAALDGFGREIVVEYGVMKKLSALEGYDRIKGKEARLCICYKEEGIQPVQTIGKQESQGESENNHIQESYTLFLMDGVQEESKVLPESNGLIARVVLLEHEDYHITVSMPSKICKKSEVKIAVTVAKYSDTDKALSYYGVLKLPVLLSEDGTQELDIAQEDIALRKGETLTFDYWLTVADSEAGSTEFLWRDNQIKVKIGDEEIVPAVPERIAADITELTPEELIRWEAGKRNLEQRAEAHKEYICLAHIYLADIKSGPVIDYIAGNQVSKYLNLPAHEDLRRQYLSYCCCPAWPKEQPEPSVNEPPIHSEEEHQQPREYQSWIRGGVLEIPLELNCKKGKIFYSEEIIHGLGEGNVYVTVGLGNGSDKAGRKETSESAVYGNHALFEENKASGMHIETAVKVCYNRGSFQAAAKITGEQNTVVLTIHWIAMKISGGIAEIKKRGMQPMKIVPETVTARLSPGEKFHFGVRFHNMEPCRLSYELVEDDGGEIAPDGIYTAPAKSGIYEIKISCDNDKGICTYVYAVVGGRE